MKRKIYTIFLKYKKHMNAVLYVDFLDIAYRNLFENQALITV